LQGGELANGGRNMTDLVVTRIQFPQSGERQDFRREDGKGIVACIETPQFG